jgi:hypothetical protein
MRPVHRPPVAGNRKSEPTASYVKVAVLRGVMTGTVVLIFMGLLVYGTWQIVSKIAPDERPKCCVCSTTKRTLQWMRSWQDWYCWPCKERCIRATLRALIGEHA